MKLDPDAFLGIAHCTLPVRDIELAERFYIEVLGGKVSERMDAAKLLKTHPGVPLNPRSIYLEVKYGNESAIALFVQQEGQAKPNLAHPHIAIHVRPEIIDPFMARLEKYRIPFQGPLRRGPVGQVSVYFNDPWGNHLEFLATGYAGETKFAPPRFAEILYDGWNPPAKEEIAP